MKVVPITQQITYNNESGSYTKHTVTMKVVPITEQITYNNKMAVRLLAVIEGILVNHEGTRFLELNSLPSLE